MFTPVVTHNSIHKLLVMVALCDLELEKLYVKTNFLHSEHEEHIYMHQLGVKESKIMSVYWRSHYIDWNNLQINGISGLILSLLGMVTLEGTTINVCIIKNLSNDFFFFSLFCFCILMIYLLQLRIWDEIFGVQLIIFWEWNL